MTNIYTKNSNNKFTELLKYHTHYTCSYFLILAFMHIFNIASLFILFKIKINQFPSKIFTQEHTLSRKIDSYLAKLKIYYFLNFNKKTIVIERHGKLGNSTF